MFAAIYAYHSESGEFSAVRSTPMGLGTKNRQKQTADLCKTAFPGKYPDKLRLVEELIVEIKGHPS